MIFPNLQCPVAKAGPPPRPWPKVLRAPKACWKDRPVVAPPVEAQVKAGAPDERTLDPIAEAAL